MPATVRRGVRRVRVLAALTIAVLVVATTVIEIALAQAVTTSRSGLADVETTLTEAGALANSTADVADRISKLGDGVATGIGASANALDATQSLITSINQLVDVLATVASRVRSVSTDLATASQQLRDVQTSLRTSEQQVRALLPQLQESATSLRDLPARLNAAGRSAGQTRDDVGTLGMLGRIAVALVALVLALLTLVISESAVLRARATALSSG